MTNNNIDLNEQPWKTMEKLCRQALGDKNRVLIAPEHAIDLIEEIRELQKENKELRNKISKYDGNTY